MSTLRLTTAQALVKFLSNQFVERDGKENKFFAGFFGIFGHGNVAGIGQALHESKELKYYQTRNEQAMVHTAAAYAKVKNRLETFVCTSSIGPGATNMITAAAGATINRLPVLLLPGDIFSTRVVPPVLQQLEDPRSHDISVNDCFKPISKYWDRINRPEQLILATLEAMRTLTSQIDTGTVTLAMPQDIQTEAFDYPIEFFEKRIWHIGRSRADRTLINLAAEKIRASKKPLIVSGGGVIYSEATEELLKFVSTTGIPYSETFAGKGALRYDVQQNLGAIGVTGTEAANIIARQADLIIGIGTRYSDFTTASNTLFENPNVSFININIAEYDAFKKQATPIVGDAKVIIEDLLTALKGYKVDNEYSQRVKTLKQNWEKTRDAICNHIPDELTQTKIVELVNDELNEKDIMVCAAGSLPGDLHKLWNAKSEKNFHLEYGYSCMGYEIAGGLGVKMANPENEVYVMVGDGNYLMMPQEIITTIQEDKKVIIVLINNNGFASIGALSESVGSKRFGTKYKYRDKDSDELTGENLPVDFAMNVKSLGADVLKAKSIDEFSQQLKIARQNSKTTVIYVETDVEDSVGGYAWWDVAVAETSNIDTVQKAREIYEENKKKQRYYL